MPPKTIHHILVKPAGPDCNLACAYCFYLSKRDLFGAAGSHRMTPAVQAETVRQAMQQGGDEVAFTWQGGEPTLMGLDFFRRAVALQQEHGRGQTVGNALQTNGLLIDREWAAFLAEYRFLVGLSIDGPAPVHDHYRRTPGGGGSWQRAAEAAERLQAAGVAVNALCVVTDHSARFADEIYAGCKEMGLAYMQFVPCVEPLPGRPGRTAPWTVDGEAWGRFLCRVFDLWLADFEGGMPATSVRNFESLLFAAAGLEPPECTLRRTCGDYLVVEHSGEVFACDFFVTPEWRLGNVMDGLLGDMLGSRRQRDFGRRKADLAAVCRKCPVLPLCRGGCPKDRLAQSGRGRVSHLCAGTRRFLDHAGPRLEALAETARPKTETPAAAPGRNAPCPCGSGRKYKRCCGRET